MTDSSQPTAKFTFGFSKKLAQPKVLEKSAISDPSAIQGKEETDFVLEVNEGGVKGTLKEEKKKGPLVIPCKTVNDWTIRGRDGGQKNGNDADNGVGKEKEDKEDKEKSKRVDIMKERSKEVEGDKGEDKPKSTEDEAVKELLEEAR